MAEIYELDAPDYERYEVDWLQNNNRGTLNTDFVKWFNNEKDLLNTKVKKQLINFKDNLLTNVAKPFTGPTRTNLIKDFKELEKVLSASIDNAPLGPSVKTKSISVAENLANNEMEKIQSTLKIQGFDGTLLPDGGISVPYYDESSNYTPKDSWIVKNEGRQAIITHSETGLKLQLDRNGLSFVDDNNFKINNKTINYESVFDSLEDFNDARPEKQIARQDMPTIDDFDDDPGMEGFDDTKYEDNFPPDQPEGKGPTEKDLYKNNPDRADIISDIEMNNNIPKGSISKLGLALDPISEGLEFALKGIGLGSIANWWVKAEVANLVAGLIRGAGAASGVAQLGQSQALMGEEFTADADAIKNAFKTNLGQQMKLSPGLWLENKYAESKFGKGQTPSEQTLGWVKNMFGASQ